jgi:hypothetical protein
VDDLYVKSQELLKAANEVSLIKPEPQKVDIQDTV